MKIKYKINTMLPIMFKKNWFPTMLETFLNDEFVSNEETNAPAVNIKENDSGYFMEIAMPGIKKDSCKIMIEDELVSISIKNEKKSEEKENHKWIRKEFSYFDYERKYSIPEDVDKEKISAKIENGILSIDLPKTKTKENKKALEINIE